MTEPGLCLYDAAVIAAILTGGRARRFHGRDKSRLVIDGRPILERQLELVGPVVSDILIVTSEARAASFAGTRMAAGAPPVHVAVDRYPDSGPLGAILTALESTSADAVFVIAGDMPDVTRRLVEALAALHGEPGSPAATVPVSARGLEPLCAIYGRAAEAPLRAAFDAGRLSLQAVLADLEPRVLPLDAVARAGDPETLFRNINSPGDLNVSR